jgi:hypothetical protein
VRGRIQSCILCEIIIFRFEFFLISPALSRRRRRRLLFFSSNTKYFFSSKKAFPTRGKGETEEGKTSESQRAKAAS